MPARLDAMSSLSAAMSADIMSDLKSNNAQYAVVATGNQKVYKSKKLNL